MQEVTVFSDVTLPYDKPCCLMFWVHTIHHVPTGATPSHFTCIVHDVRGQLAKLQLPFKSGAMCVYDIINAVADKSNFSQAVQVTNVVKSDLGRFPIKNLIGIGCDKFCFIALPSCRIGKPKTQQSKPPVAMSGQSGVSWGYIVVRIVGVTQPSTPANSAQSASSPNMPRRYSVVTKTGETKTINQYMNGRDTVEYTTGDIVAFANLSTNARDPASVNMGTYATSTKTPIGVDMAADFAAAPTWATVGPAAPSNFEEFDVSDFGTAIVGGKRPRDTNDEPDFSVS